MKITIPKSVFKKTEHWSPDRITVGPIYMEIISIDSVTGKEKINRFVFGREDK